MGKFYLFVLPTPANQRETSSVYGEQIYARVETSSVPIFEEADRLLLVDSKGADYEAVLPGVARIVHLDRQKSQVTLETEKAYNNKVPIDTVRGILNRPLSTRATQITQTEFDAIVSQMGGVMLKEKHLLDYIKRYIAARGYYFDDET